MCALAIEYLAFCPLEHCTLIAQLSKNTEPKYGDHTHGCHHDIIALCALGAAQRYTDTLVLPPSN